jgi:hypothetical protein
LFLLDDVAYDVDLPVYDKYEDDCDVEDISFQQYSGTNQPMYHSYKEKNIRPAEENYLPLYFASFKLLKENSKIIIEANELVLMQNHTKPTRQINKILQHSSHVFDDPITCCAEDLASSKVQPLVEYKDENDHVQQSKEIEKCAYNNNEEIEESFESGKRTLPLCFSSFELLKQNICNVSNQKASRHDAAYEEGNGLTYENWTRLKRVTLGNSFRGHRIKM